MNKKLTTQEYWEQYYKRDYANRSHIIGVCSYYDRFWKQFISEDSTGKTIIEIGGFPGRYLAYLASKYNLIPTCLDYNSDINQIEAVFKIMDVTNYTILQEDFTIFHPKIQYDYVISNGFIEHFDHFNDILDLHLPYIKSGGKLYVMIPNMRGYIRFYKYLVDYKNLKIHNIKSMRLKVFRDFAERNLLKIIHLSYFGDFPYNVHQKLNFVQKLIFKLNRLFFRNVGNRLINKYPSAYFSSTIIAIFEKN